jgi:large subunit ribosomal protein L4
MSLKAAVITAEGKKGRAKNLPEELFDGTVHKPALYQTIKAQRANLRQGDAATKKRSEVAGGKRKPWRQKGTGRARQGSTRSPQWRGGGIVFGPTGDENHSQKVPRKVKALARRSALNARAQDGRLFLLRGLEMDAPKTKRIIEIVGASEATGNVLILTNGHQPLVHLSARNLPNVHVLPFGEESAYDVLWSETVIIDEDALGLSKSSKGAEESEEGADA